MIEFVSLSVAVPADILGWSNQKYNQNHILLIKIQPNKNCYIKREDKCNTQDQQIHDKCQIEMHDIVKIIQYQTLTNIKN